MARRRKSCGLLGIVCISVAVNAAIAEPQARPAAPSALVASQKPSLIRSVQCGVVPSQEEAHRLRERLAAEGFGPVMIIGAEGSYRVLVGRCEYQPEAILLKRDLRKHGFTDAFEKAIPVSDVKPGPFQCITPERGVFNSDGGRKSEMGAPVILEFAVPTELDRLAVALARHDEGALIASAGVVDRLPDNDPAKGWMQTRLAAARIARDQKAKPHLQLLLDVANGRIAAPPDVRLEAEWMAADSLHYYLFKPLDAFAAYRCILERHGEDPGVRARALVEVSACLMELAQMKQAYFNEVRRSCQVILDTVPPRYERARAVADLMSCETLIYDGTPEAALKALEGFETRHPNRPRERAKVLEWRGYLLGKLGKTDQATKAYVELLSVDLSDPREQFFWNGKSQDPRKAAKEWLQLYKVDVADGDEKVKKARQPDSKPAVEAAGIESPIYQVDVLLTIIEQARSSGGAGRVTTATAKKGRSFDPAFPHAVYEEAAQ